ncbi:helix-turn-helix transcriptional regulator [Amycolatopsis lurida]
MDRRGELKAFLRSRRARLRPGEVGLPEHGTGRRVPGLRREELAQLAGLSLDYYVRLEQGRNGKISPGALDALARALRMSPVEREHLHRLAKPARNQVVPRCLDSPVPRLQQLLDSMPAVPAYVVGRRTELLAWNRPAQLVFGGVFVLETAHRSIARQIFLNPMARQRFENWEDKAVAVTSRLRLGFGRFPGDRLLTDLIDELTAVNSEFRRIWAEQHLNDKTHGAYRIALPRIGSFTLPYRALRLPEEPDQLLITYLVEPGSTLAGALGSRTTIQAVP